VTQIFADNRRRFLITASATALLGACRARTPEGAEPEKEVGATEDLMREHGVIRRVLVVYRESAARLRSDPRSVPPAALHRAATLIRTFAEDYHEKMLEEAYIFPVVKSAGGDSEVIVRALLAQHQRGREVTDYVLAVTRGQVSRPAAAELAITLEAFARMYEEHAAMEDTIVFPTWKSRLSGHDLEEMGDRFEEIEHRTFGHDGFEDAVRQVASIETELGVDLAAFLPPPPPRGG
jgi:hemerythrin-like domain-containing protein